MDTSKEKAVEFHAQLLQLYIHTTKSDIRKQMYTSFCSRRKLVQATKFFTSSPIFPASPSKTYFCIDSAVPAHKNVFSLASSRILNNSWDDTGSREGLAWTISCKQYVLIVTQVNAPNKRQRTNENHIMGGGGAESYQKCRPSPHMCLWERTKSCFTYKCCQRLHN